MPLRVGWDSANGQVGVSFLHGATLSRRGLAISRGRLLGLGNHHRSSGDQRSAPDAPQHKPSARSAAQRFRPLPTIDTAHPVPAAWRASARSGGRRVRRFSTRSTALAQHWTKLKQHKSRHSRRAASDRRQPLPNRGEGRSSGSGKLSFSGCLRSIALIGQATGDLTIVLLYFGFFNIGERRIPSAGVGNKPAAGFSSSATRSSACSQSSTSRPGRPFSSQSLQAHCLMRSSRSVLVNFPLPLLCKIPVRSALPMKASTR